VDTCNLCWKARQHTKLRRIRLKRMLSNSPINLNKQSPNSRTNKKTRADNVETQQCIATTSAVLVVYLWLPFSDLRSSGLSSRAFQVCQVHSELYRDNANSFLAIWLKFWTDDNEKRNDSAGHYLGIYAALQIMGVIWFAILIWYLASNKLEILRAN